MNHGQLTFVTSLNDGDDIVIDGNTTTIERIHPSQGRVPADGNRVQVLHTSDGVHRLRSNDAVRRLRIR